MNFLAKPLPGWVTIALFVFTFMGGAYAATTVWNGGLKVPTGSTITDVNATASTCVATNASKIYAYGTNCVDIPNPQSITGSKQFNAAATPNPAATGFHGNPVVAQAAAVPTPQPGNAAITGNYLGNTYQVGSYLSGNLQMGLTGQNLPYLGCTGTSIAACELSFFTDGLSSASQVNIDSLGNIYPNASTSVNIGTSIGATSLGSVTCNNFFWGSSSAMGSASVPKACGDTSGDFAMNGNLTVLGAASVSGNLTVSGSAAITSPSTVNGGRLTPCYQAGGTACASTWHVVTGIQSTTVSGTCASTLGSACAVSAAVTLTGSAVFTSASSYTCTGTDSLNMQFNGLSGTATASSLSFLFINTSGATQTGAAITINYFCFGT